MLAFVLLSAALALVWLCGVLEEVNAVRSGGGVGGVGKLGGLNHDEPSYDSGTELEDEEDEETEQDSSLLSAADFTDAETMLKREMLLKDLADRFTDPWEVGCTIDSPWVDFVQKDPKCNYLLGKFKPDVRENCTGGLMETFRRCPVYPTPKRLFAALDDDWTKSGSGGSKPSETFPTEDMTVMVMRLLDMGYMRSHETKSAGDSLVLTCGKHGDIGTDQPYIGGATNTIALADAANEESVPFAKTLIDGVSVADTFWTQKQTFLPVGGKMLRKQSLANQIFHEAVVAAQVKDSTDDTSEAGFFVANFDGKKLNAVTKGGKMGLSVFRRSERARFQRFPFASTATSHSSSSDWTISSNSDASGAAASPPEETYSLILEHDDLVVLMSDGITDNMYTTEIAALVTRAVSPGESYSISHAETQIREKDEIPWSLPHFKIDPRFSFMQDNIKYTTPPEKLAELLVLASRQHLANEAQAGPFAVESLLAGETMEYVGRADNMTAIVCWVTDQMDNDSLDGMWASSDLVAGKPMKPVK